GHHTTLSRWVSVDRNTNTPIVFTIGLDGSDHAVLFPPAATRRTATTDTPLRRAPDYSSQRARRMLTASSWRRPRASSVADPQTLTRTTSPGRTVPVRATPPLRSVYPVTR